MCNAQNHSYDCNCGFGGDTGGHPVQWRSDWSLWEDPSPITYPTTCWWCGAFVYFFRDSNGGCALFDYLGAPWEVHDCWRKYAGSRRAALEHVNSEMRAQGFSGSLDTDDYESAEVPSKPVLAKPFWGYVVENESIRWPQYPSMWESDIEGLAMIQVAFESTIFRVHCNPNLARAARKGLSVSVSGRWVQHDREIHFIAFELESPDAEGNTVWRKTDPIFKTFGKCALCGGQVQSDDDWRLLPDLRIECATCNVMRGEMEAADFRRQCIKIARHRQH